MPSVLAVPGLASVAIVVALSGAAPAAAASAATSVDVGLPAGAVVIDHAAHTAYVAVSDGVSSEVAVVSTTHHDTVAAVELTGQAAPAALAYDAKNHTVYVAEAGSGGVSMIDASTCNAAKHASCSTTPKRAALGLIAPSAIAVDTSHHDDAVYVADGGGHRVVVFGGKRCNDHKTGGCHTTRSVSVGTAPSALAVDGAVNTVYVANLGSNTVSTLKRSACSTLKAACKKRGHTLTLGASADPAAVLVDRSTRTLYVADSGTNAVAFVNTSTCNIGVHKACGRTPHVRHGFAGADGIALTASGGLAVASAAGDAVVAFRSSTCNAHSRRGCSTSVHPLAGSPAGIASNGMSVYVSDVTNSSVDIVHIGKG